jgi:hypothetical protein
MNRTRDSRNRLGRLRLDRTRLIFIVVVIACLAILAASAARQVLGTERLLQIYIAGTVFAGGVVLLDLVGVLGGHQADGFAGHAAGGHDFAAQDISGHAGAGHDGGGQEDASVPAGGHPAGSQDATGDGHAAAGQNGDQVAHSSAQAPVAGAAPVLSILAYLRLLVYFCLGFGPAGWAALARGWGALGSLLLAVPVGLLAVFAARAFFRFQRQDTGAVPPDVDLLRERAEVIVPLDDRTMGKVRVTAGMSVSDLYALSAEPGRHYERGDVVQIVEVTDDCVRVR